MFLVWGGWIDVNKFQKTKANIIIMTTTKDLPAYVLLFGIAVTAGVCNMTMLDFFKPY